MGFKCVNDLCENPQGYLITSYKYPNNPLFVFEEFYQRLADAGKQFVDVINSCMVLSNY